MKSEKELSILFSKDVSKFQSLCRICLCELNESGVELFNDKECEIKDESLQEKKLNKMLFVHEKIVICCGISVGREDSLPKAICEPCNYDLDLVHAFRMKCQQSDILLKKILNQHSTLELENETKADLPMTVPGALVEKGDLPVLFLDHIKEELADYSSDAGIEDFHDHYKADVEVKKKKKKSIKKCKVKKVKNEAEKADLIVKIENGNTQAAVSPKRDCNEELEEQLGIQEISSGSKEKKFVCDVCSKPLATKVSLSNHIEKMHGEQKKLKMGMVTGYGADRRFHCTECDYKCRRRQALHYHMTIHTGIKPFQCDQCPKSFAQHGSLYTHRKTHSDKMYYTCQECGKQFKHRDIFKNHRRVHSNEYQFSCKICNKGLKTQKTLNEHMNRHLQIKNFSCEVCGLAFVTRMELANHSRVHNKTNTYQCSFCEYSSYSKKTLSVHIKRHTGERSFTCEHCEYSCYTPGELRFHVRKHTKEQNYSCPVCDMKFRHSTSVNKHMLRRHGEKYKWSDTVDRRVVK